MPDPIVALTLTDAERAAVPCLWPEANDADPIGTAFLKWQRDAFAAEVEIRAAAKAAQDAQATVRDAVKAAREQFPSVFDVPVTPEQ